MISKAVLLVRHSESTKNIADEFASSLDNHSLTERGARSAEELASDLADFVGYLERRRIDLLTSPAPRALECALQIGTRFGVPPVESSALESIVNPEIAGLSFDELLVQDRKLARQLNLYRAGLFNSYDLARISRNTRPYEERVAAELDRIANLDADLVVVVAHRSFITFALLHAARIAGGYPVGFFGFVPIDYESISMLLMNDSAREGISVQFANVPSSALSTVGISLLD